MANRELSNKLASGEITSMKIGGTGSEKLVETAEQIAARIAITQGHVDINTLNITAVNTKADDNAADIVTNTADIATNTGNVSTNTADIASLSGVKTGYAAVGSEPRFLLEVEAAGTSAALQMYPKTNA